MKQIILKRAYEAPSPEDGFRVYIDRLWPRGLSHETFHYDLWEKDISPSTELREWYHCAPEERWEEFEKRYLNELKQNPAVADFLNVIADKPVVTLLYSSHDTKHNNAVVLKNYLETRFSDKQPKIGENIRYLHHTN